MSIDVVQEEEIDEHDISERFKNENWAPEELPESQPLLKDESVIPSTQVDFNQEISVHAANQVLHERTTSNEFLQSTSSPITKESTMDEYVDYPDQPIPSVDSLPPAGQQRPTSPKPLIDESENHMFSLPAVSNTKRQSSEESEYVSPKKKTKTRKPTIVKTVKREYKATEIQSKFEKLTHDDENAKLLEVSESLLEHSR
jgi:hypothetical protein